MSCKTHYDRVSPYICADEILKLNSPKLNIIPTSSRIYQIHCINVAILIINKIGKRNKMARQPHVKV